MYLSSEEMECCNKTIILIKKFAQNKFEFKMNISACRTFTFFSSTR